jgi:hypothetical protein
LRGESWPELGGMSRKERFHHQFLFCLLSPVKFVSFFSFFYVYEEKRSGMGKKSET